jgi:DNA-binding HxlR family transcriptional regulator/putative sterol carrier protein
MLWAMSGKRTYGDMCRFAHALDIVGERWALLVVRELVLGPKRFTDLRAGLPNASPNVLSQRLRELEEAGVVQRRKLPPPAASRVYELTEWGAELGPIVTQLGHWGTRAPNPPDGDFIGPDSIALAFRSHFDPVRTADVQASYELRFGESDYTLAIDRGELELRKARAEDPDLVIETDPPSLGRVLGGEQEPAEALGTGAVRILEGDEQAFAELFRFFPISEPAPAPAAEAA